MTPSSKRSESLRSKLLISGALLVFLAAVLFPFFTTGFIADDCLNSQTGIGVERMGMSVLDWALHINHAWMTGPGRFYPLAWIMGYHFFAAFPGVDISRFLHMLTVVINVVIAGALFLRWSGKRFTDLLVFVPVLASLFQLREWFDPIAGYAPFLQSVCFFLLSSILCLDLAQDTRRIRYAVLSVLLFVAALLTYEVAVLFLPLILFFIFFKEKKIIHGLARSAPYILTSVFYLLILLYLRAHRGAAYSGTEMSLDFEKIFDALYYQVSAAFPLNYYSNLPIYFQDLRKFWPTSIAAKLSVFGGVILFYLGLRNLESKNHGPPQLDFRLIVLGLGLLFLPAIPVALSQRWQTEVGPGMGYLPVYLSYFGLAILASATLVWGIGSARFKRLPVDMRATLRVVLVGGLAYALFYTHLSNQRASQRLNMTWRYPRDRLVAAYDSGLLKAVKPGSIFVTNTFQQWLTPDLSRKTYRTVDRIIDFGGGPLLPRKEFDGRDVYYLQLKETSLDYKFKGALFFSKVLWDVQASDKKIRDRVKIVQPTIYYEDLQNRPVQIELRCNGKQVEQLYGESKGSQRGYFLSAKSFSCPLASVTLEVKYL